jgi:hypothetical protein
MRHGIQYRPVPRGLTPRRLAAARRALSRERDRYALFADEVAAEQETPEQRIDRFDLRMLEQEQAHRDLAAKHWRWGRRQLEAVSEEIRDQILSDWNKAWTPSEAHYFADFVRTRLKRLGITLTDDAA